MDIPVMTREEAVEFVDELVQGVNAHDTARLLRLYAEDAVTKTPMFPEIAGRAAIAKSWDTIFSLFPDWTAEVKDVLVDGDRIAFIGIAGATDRNGWFGQPPTGEHFEYRAFIVLKMAQGKIVRDERIYDLEGVLRRLEQARLARELKMAAEVQRALLPRTEHLPAFCDAAGDSVPCRAIGGDFFEWVRLPSGEFGLVLGDVAGKGPAAAILAAMIQGMLSVEMQKESGPSAILARLNRLLAGRGLESSFATLVLGVLSPGGKLVYSIAGHNPPILLTRQGVRRLRAGGPVLGVLAEPAFDEETVELSEGDTIVLFSDGVIEARDAQDREFGDDRLTSCVTACVARPASDVLKGILARVQEFCGGAPQADDITVMVARFRR